MKNPDYAVLHPGYKCFRHAGMDRRHPVPQDASGDIRVNLGSGSPCRNDEIVLYCLRNSEGKIPLHSAKFSKEHTKITKVT